MVPGDASLLLDRADALGRGNRKGVQDAVAIYSKVLQVMGAEEPPVAAASDDAAEGVADASASDDDDEPPVEISPIAVGGAAGTQRFVADLLFGRSELFRRQNSLEKAAADLWRACRLLGAGVPECWLRGHQSSDHSAVREHVWSCRIARHPRVYPGWDGCRKGGGAPRPPAGSGWDQDSAATH